MFINVDYLSWWQVLLLLIVCIAALLGLFVLDAWILSAAWNWVMPSVFSLPFLNLSQAMEMIIISDILIGNPILTTLIWRNAKS